MSQAVKLALLGLVIFLFLFSFSACKDTETDDSDTHQSPKTMDCGERVDGSTVSLAALWSSYPGVDWAETGPETLYQIHLNDVKTLRIDEFSAVFEADYFLLREKDNVATLLTHGDHGLIVDCLEPGDYYLVVDGRNGESGEFSFDVGCVSCEDGDEDDYESDEDVSDGDKSDGEEPDGGDCISCLTAMDCSQLGPDWVCQDDCCIEVSPDGDQNGDIDKETDGDTEIDGDTLCEPSETRCDGERVQICSGSGTSWGNGEDCKLSDKICENGACFYAQDCSVILTHDSSSESGVYTVDPDGNDDLPPMEVYCDQVTDGGGWTIIDYSRSNTWQEYYSSFRLINDEQAAIPDISASTSYHRSWFLLADSETQFRISPDCTDVASTSYASSGYAATGNYYGCIWYNRNCDMGENQICQTCTDPYGQSTQGACTHLIFTSEDNWNVIDSAYGLICSYDWWNRNPSVGTNGAYCMAYRTP